MKKFFYKISKIILWILFFVIIISGIIGGFSYRYYYAGYTSLSQEEKHTILIRLKETDIILNDSGGSRRTGNTLMSIPEWYIVSISEDYTRWLETDNNPSDFPYFQYLKDYWYLYGRITSVMDIKFPRDSEYHTMVRVIGISTTLEFGLKGLYEMTFGRLSTMDSYLSNEDIQYRTISREYVNFILLRPWYEFDFTGAFSGFQCTLSTFRSIERCGIISLELRLKKYYAKIIQSATHASFAIPDMWTEVEGIFPSGEIYTTGSIIKTNTGIKIPRYYPFTKLLPDIITGSGVIIDKIAGNTVIGVEIVSETGNLVGENPVALIRIPIDSSLSRTFSLIPIEELSSFIEKNREKIVHIYDF